VKKKKKKSESKDEASIKTTPRKTKDKNSDGFDGRGQRLAIRPIRIVETSGQQPKAG